MALDILTPRGQQTLEDEARLLTHLRMIYEPRGYIIVETNKDEPGKIDGLIIRTSDMTVAAGFENKCRYDMDRTLLKSRGSWLITNQKLVDAVTITKGLCVPLHGYLYLTQDESIFQWKITDKWGTYQFPFEIAETRTQRTVNGGSAIRANAYLPVEYAKRLR